LLSPSPGDAGRRSRRGFAYQDAVTLLDCLDMHDGKFEEVGFEDLDDIVCVLGPNVTYRQVKTIEDGSRHSIYTVCNPKIKGKPETSILGRLFSGKPITQFSDFCLLLNETPGKDLAAFRATRGCPRGEIPQNSRDHIARRLKGLLLPDNVEIDWCIDKFEILVESRTIEEVEAIICRQLVEPVTKVLGSQPLPSELDDILIHLGRLVAREAQAVKPRRWSATQFDQSLRKEVARVTGRRQDGSIAPLPSLSEKLACAGVPDDEAIAQTEALLDYRRRYRSAIGQERAMLNTLNDHVFSVCVDVSAQRRAGLIPEGPKAYAATIQGIRHIEILGMRIAMPEKIAALSDVTARCQNRYSDDS
jgi:hypothetical protein